MRKAPARAAPLVLVLAACTLFAILVGHVVRLRTELADFLPAGRSEAAQLMMEEVTSGEAASLILIGIDSAPAPDLARLSEAIRGTLASSAAFAFVQNGHGGLEDLVAGDLFQARYLLSPAVSAEMFEEPALRGDFERLFDALQSSASPVVSQFGFADPTGAFLAMLRTWSGSTQVRTEHGVWFSHGSTRALLVARFSDNVVGAAARSAALAQVQAAFAGADPGSAKLVVSGPAVFARDTARTIRGDVEFLSYVSAALIVGLLLWRFRSLWIVAVIAIPVTLSITVATLAVQLTFGFVHGIAFGFGMTMLGVTVDYPVLLIGHRKQREAAPDTLRRIGRAFRLAVCTVVVGLSGMALSPFPGLAQLGIFAMVGSVTAAVTTWWLLPPLIVAIDLAPVPPRRDAELLRIEHLRRWRVWTLAVPALAAAALILKPPVWEGDLQNLSPIDPAARALDRTLRSQLGAPDVGQLLIVRGASAEDVLQRQEKLLLALAALQRDGKLAGAEFAAHVLPSVETQESRRALLPDPKDLQARVDAALAGTAFREDAFAPFVEAVAASRTLAPVTLASLGNSPLAARLRPLLFKSDGGWVGPVIPRGMTDGSALRALAAPGAGETVFVDMRAEMNALVSDSTAQAWRWLALGAILALVALAVGLRDARQVMQVAGAMAAACVTTIASLSLLDIRLSIITIVSIQFVVGVGLDYALFFARRQLDAEERARTLRTLATCNVMTLVTFGLLATCRTPLLRDMGLTVVLGVVTSMVFAFQFVGEKRVPA